MIIKVKRDKDGEVFTSDMSTSRGIIEIHFCTSYTQVIIQEEIDGKFPESHIICPPEGSEPSWIDQIATVGDDTGVLYV